MKLSALVKGARLIEPGDPEDRVVLLAFPPKPGVSSDALEKAAWAFMRQVDGEPAQQSDAVVPVESSIARGPAWTVGGQIVKAGTWVLGLHLNEQTWRLYKSDELSPRNLLEMAQCQFDLKRKKVS